ncbi:major facilitator superfamily domain-containing protein [Zychaea mexicana]|uniref:major facilitator superfamily domain-containing protein n=1 Tax=Zychaea mexicana TaxID=64656 RepID=UPI0022FEC6AF|nr:major facilitator superfamily domain-containing protein [Zychaea mexicana]KAI9494315.1 major facilitator superfamily domain-containing protein [Zychaea mexicana]
MIVLCSGIFQNYYESNAFGKSNDAVIKLSGVGTLIPAVIYIFFWPSNHLYTYTGPKVLLGIGTLMISAGLVAASMISEIWQLYLSVGVCSGIGVSILYAVSLRVIPQWFHKKRSMAFTIISSSASFAGIVLPFVVTLLNNALNARWTFRILGIAFLFLNLIALILIKERPQTNIQGDHDATESKPKVGMLKETNVILWGIINLLQVCILYLPPTFLPSYATYIGLSDIQGSAIISVICAAALFGRICLRATSSRLGVLNMLIFSTIICGLSCFLLWMFAYNFATLMTFAVIYGFFSGGYTALGASVTILLVGSENISFTLSVLSVINGFGTSTITIASVIESLSSSEPFLTYKFLCGCTCIVSALLLIIIKRRLYTKMLTIL